MNGCDYVFKIGEEALGENTVDLVCPEEGEVVVSHGSTCTLHIPPAEGLMGVTYETIELHERHAITASMDVSGIEANFEAGYCVLLGTKQEGELSGSVTVEAYAAPAVDITAIGSKD